MKWQGTVELLGLPDRSLDLSDRVRAQVTIEPVPHLPPGSYLVGVVVHADGLPLPILTFIGPIRFSMTS